MTVLDVGSYDLNGCLRPIFDKHTYIGCDLTEGSNVDVVQAGPYALPNGPWDVIVSASMFEHCPNPFLMVHEMYRVLKPGGLTAHTVPWSLHYHGQAHFKDYFRMSPDALRMLFESFEIIECRFDELDSYIVARKPL
jgi:SAM-dependent methyltransferase